MKVKYQKLCETPFCDYQEKEGALYCEMEFMRDRSSFAGLAFETNNTGIITFSNYKPILYKQQNKFEKIYIGMEKSYSNSIYKKYKLMNICKGINVLFLVYSDVRSSSIVFEKLIEWLGDNI